MAIDGDNSVSLPTPPPPRPAARREAIEAALKKFDGIEVPAKRPARSWWASHQRQLGAFATAAIIAVVSIPVALSVLQDQPKSAPQARAPAVVQPRPNSRVAAEDVQPEPPPNGESTVAEVPRSKLPLEPHEESAPLGVVAEKQKAANETQPAVAAVPPAPPPPPPPPPAPAPERDEAADAGESAPRWARRRRP